MKKKDRAVALREAAIRWVEASRLPVKDSKDRAFGKVDRALQRAARQFSQVK